MKLFRHFGNPAPVNEKPWSTVWLCMGVCAFVLAVFEPFAFRLNNGWQVLMLLGFVLLVFITGVLFFVGLPCLFPAYFSPERWTYGRLYGHALLFFGVTGIGVFLYEYVWLGRHGADDFWTRRFFVVLGIDLLAAASIGLIPVVISFYVSRSRNLKRNLEEAVHLNAILSRRLTMAPAEAVTLGGNTREPLSVVPDRILYIEAQGNYVRVVYRAGDAAEQKHLRSTIKQTEEELADYPFILRCHRAFLVNVNGVKHIAGNAQGYRLTLNGTEQKVPVSRTYMKSLKDTLK